MSSPDRDAAEAEVGDEAAADEAADEVVDEPAPKKAAPGTKKIQGIKSRIAAAEVRYEKNIGYIAKVQAKVSAGTTRARDKENLEKWQSAADAATAAISALKKELSQAEEHAAVLAQKELKAAEVAAEKAEAKKSLTEAAFCAIVASKIKYDARFANNSDTNASVWGHVLDHYRARVKVGELAATDDISTVKGIRDRCAHASPTARAMLRPMHHVTCLSHPWLMLFFLLFFRRYDNEYRTFKIWAAKANRAVEQSGVPRDKVEEMVTDFYRCAPAVT